MREKAPGGALIWFQLEEILTVHGDLASSHLVIGMTGQHLGKGALAGAIWAHDGVHFATRNGQTKTPDDLLVSDRHAEVIDPKLVHR